MTPYRPSDARAVPRTERRRATDVAVGSAPTTAATCGYGSSTPPAVLGHADDRPPARPPRDLVGMADLPPDGIRVAQSAPRQLPAHDGDLFDAFPVVGLERSAADEADAERFR